MLIDRLFSASQLDGIIFSKKDALGRSLYFPSRIFGPGYVVETEEQKRCIIDGYIHTADVFIAAALIVPLIFSFLGMPLNFGVVAAAALIGLLAFPLRAMRYVRDMEKTSESPTLREAHKATAKSTSWRMLIFMEVVAILLLCGRVFILIQSWSWDQFAIAVGLGIGVLVFGYQILLKLESGQN